MAKKVEKTNLRSDDSSYEERLMVLVENLGDEIKLVAEGNLMLGERFDRMEQKMDGGFKEIRQEMQGGFKSTVEYLLHIDEEITQIKNDLKKLKEVKADKETLIIFEKRIAKIEGDLAECKNLCKK